MTICTADEGPKRERSRHGQALHLPPRHISSLTITASTRRDRSGSRTASSISSFCPAPGSVNVCPQRRHMAITCGALFPPQAPLALSHLQLNRAC